MRQRKKKTLKGADSEGEVKLEETSDDEQGQMKKGMSETAKDAEKRAKAEIAEEASLFTTEKKEGDEEEAKDEAKKSDEEDLESKEEKKDKEGEEGGEGEEGEEGKGSGESDKSEDSEEREKDGESGESEESEEDSRKSRRRRYEKNDDDNAAARYVKPRTMANVTTVEGKESPHREGGGGLGFGADSDKEEKDDHEKENENEPPITTEIVDSQTPVSEYGTDYSKRHVYDDELAKEQIRLIKSMNPRRKHEKTEELDPLENLSKQPMPYFMEGDRYSWHRSLG